MQSEVYEVVSPTAVQSAR